MRAHAPHHDQRAPPGAPLTAPPAARHLQLGRLERASRRVLSGRCSRERPRSACGRACSNEGPSWLLEGACTRGEQCAAVVAEFFDELQDLALYKKFRNKEVASAARGLIGLFRELAPGMLDKRDRGRGADVALTPLSYGASRVVSRVEGADLLQVRPQASLCEHMRSAAICAASIATGRISA